MILLFTYFSSFCVSIPLFFGFLKRKLLESNLLPVFYLLCFSIPVEILNMSMTLSGRNTMLIWNSYTVVEFVALILFYKPFFDSIKKVSIHLILIPIFVGVAVFDTFFLNDIYTFNNFSSSIEALILVIYSLLAFSFIIKNLIYENLLETPFFWVNTGILIYFSGNLFLFIFSNYLQKHDLPGYQALYPIHSILNVIFYTLISVGFWKVRRE